MIAPESGRIRSFIEDRIKIWGDRAAAVSWSLEISIFLFLTLRLAFTQVMVGNEMMYVMPAKRLFDSSYIAGDWYLSLDVIHLYVFHLLVGPLTRFLSLAAVSITMRLLGLFFLSLVLGRFARRFRLGPPLMLCILFVYLHQPSWMAISSIWHWTEASTVANILILFGLDQLLSRNHIRAAAFFGAAMSFHALVGAYGSAAFFLTMLWTHRPAPSDIFRSAGVWTATASLGISIAIRTLLEPSVPGFDATWVYVNFRVPHHLLATAWSPDALKGILIFCAFIFLLTRVQRLFPGKEDHRTLARFALFLSIPVFIGLAIAPFPWAPHLLKYYPFRGESLVIFIVELLFLPLALEGFPKMERRLLLRVGYLFLIGLGLSSVARDAPRYTPGLGSFPRTDPSVDVCLWVRENTPENVLVLHPPGMSLGPYVMNRRTVATFKAVPPGNRNLLEWYGRLTDLNGGAAPMSGRELARNFPRLRAAQYVDLAKKYHSEYLVTVDRDDLPFAKLYRNSRYAVFLLGTP